ncbi:uncharacterized protein LOC111248977 [Varroa destructor]|uniref:Uncharacterized protein n=1 Tax=Varroa destructor TaxID=109461 RepID=A0A7M7JVR3_VARDE|nr:uncharacterized protein LOC111248977 [Varroa destructor]
MEKGSWNEYRRDVQNRKTRRYRTEPGGKKTRQFFIFSQNMAMHRGSRAPKEPLLKETFLFISSSTMWIHSTFDIVILLIILLLKKRLYRPVDTADKLHEQTKSCFSTSKSTLKGTTEAARTVVGIVLPRSGCTNTVN